MEIKRVIQILEKLPEDVGLTEEDNWDNSSEVQEWRLEAIQAINTAIKLLNSKTIVGTLELNGKIYKIEE